MKLTCPSCGAEYPIEAGLLEDEGKRLAAIVGEMEPVLARTALAYLRLFKPAKTALRTARAIKVLQELLELVRVGTVCRDERNGIHRPASSAAWIAGIEQMLQQPERLRLPLSNHNYLRQIVWGIADQADAQAERQRGKGVSRQGTGGFAPAADAVDNDLRKMNDHLIWLKTQFERGFLTREDYDRQVSETRAKYSAATKGESR